MPNIISRAKVKASLGANQALTWLTTNFGLGQTGNRFNMENVINQTGESIYKAVIPKFLYKPPYS